MKIINNFKLLEERYVVFKEMKPEALVANEEEARKVGAKFTKPDRKIWCPTEVITDLNKARRWLKEMLDFAGEDLNEEYDYTVVKIRTSYKRIEEEK